MTILGGIFSFFGPALGAATLYLLDVWIHQYTVYWPTVLGAILLAILFFLPNGLMHVTTTGPLGFRVFSEVDVDNDLLVSSSTFPDVGARKPATMFRSVVLPQPDGPSTLISSPSRMSSEMS